MSTPSTPSVFHQEEMDVSCLEEKVAPPSEGRRRQEEPGQVTDEGDTFIPTVGVHSRNNTALKKRKEEELRGEEALESFALARSFS